MPITLSDLRTYAQEVAGPDVSGTTADREVNWWINQALARIWREHEWSFAKRTIKITLFPGETGSLMTLTQGSLSISLGGAETFDAKWLSELWDLHVTGEEDMVFQLAAIGTPATTATLRTGDEWLRATGVHAYTFSRRTYPLPEDAVRVDLVEWQQAAWPISYAEPYVFDYERHRDPTERQQPLLWTVRDGNLEIWPSPASGAATYESLLVSYRRGPPRHATTDLGTAEVDFPQKWEDLIQAAIVLEASKSQGKNAPVPYALAKTEYEDIVSLYKAEDSGVADLAGPMGTGYRPSDHYFPNWRGGEVVEGP